MGDRSEADFASRKLCDYLKTHPSRESRAETGHLCGQSAYKTLTRKQWPETSTSRYPPESLLLSFHVAPSLKSISPRKGRGGLTWMKFVMSCTSGRFDPAGPNGRRNPRPVLGAPARFWQDAAKERAKGSQGQPAEVDILMNRQAVFVASR